MELPFTIVFEPPSQSELRAQLRMRGHWAAGSIVALAIGAAYLLATVARADAGPPAAAVPLSLTTQPAGAVAWVDGRARGSTPLELSVEPGQHSVVLKAPDAPDSQYTVDVGPAGGALDAVLWRQQPSLTRLRPALPGAALADVRLLSDGDVGLAIGLPPDGLLQAWLLDPRSGSLETVPTGIAAPRLAFAPDGRHVAYLGPAVGPRPTGSTFAGPAAAMGEVVWLAPVGEVDEAQSATGWRAPLEPAESLEDVSWSPRADQLLVVSGQTLAGGVTRSRAWLLDADGQLAWPVLSLPSQIVPGSEVWSPDGRSLAFVAHAGEVNALCRLSVDGGFRYVADLDPSPTAPLAYPPLAWAADARRMLFVAPHQHPPGVPFDWLQPDLRHALYVDDLEHPTPLAMADTDADLVTWREDGQLLELGRAATDSPLRIRIWNGTTGASQPLAELPLKPAAGYAAVWDTSRARLLVASANPSGGIDYWLAQLGLEAGA